MIKFLRVFMVSLCMWNMLYAQELQQLDSGSTVIAFDLHGVVFKPSASKISVCLRTFPSKLLMARLLLNPVFWYNVVAVRRQTEVAEDIYRRLSVLYPDLAAYEKEFITIANAQRAQPEVIEVIKELKRKNFKVYICSNIGHATFIELEKEFPEVIALFDGVYTTTEKNNYVQKPQRDYFEAFKQFVVAREGRSRVRDILLIDDKQYNITGARECGFKALLFSSTKQFSNDFTRLIAG